jgi:putative membrane protein
MRQLLTYWSLDWTSVVLLLIVISVVVESQRLNKRIALATLLLLVISLISPLHVLSADYLFSAHMTVHVILLLCVGPLLVRLSPTVKPLNHLFGFVKRHPMAGWLTGIGTMWFWHLPVVFNSAMSTMDSRGFDLIALAEELSLIVAGMLFSAPVIHKNEKYRIDPLSGVVYLFTACIGCSLLGLLITFAPTGTYHHFLSMPDHYSLNKIITQDWGITQSMDQQAAGLIMWVPCCLIYLTGSMYLLVHWFKQKDDVIAYSKEL